MPVSNLADIPGCPYSNIEDIRRAHTSKEAIISVDKSFCINWVDLPGTNPSYVIKIFHFTLSWAMLWVGIVLSIISWHTIGVKGLLLIPVSLLAGLYCRPWRGYLSWFIALGLLIFTKGLLSWFGGAWLLTAFLVSGWYEWCADRLTEKILKNESLLIWSLQPRESDHGVQNPIAVIKKIGNRHE